MIRNYPFQVIGYHSCDREIGLDVLRGGYDLKASENDWDWLGGGIYFWEQDPKRAIDYSIEVVKRTQISRGNITNPFILGAVINLGHCLNLVESESLELLGVAYNALKLSHEKFGTPLPKEQRSEPKIGLCRYKICTSISERVATAAL